MHPHPQPQPPTTRRPDGNSCNSKTGSATADESNSTIDSHAPPPTTGLSVTVLHREDLPQYSCERFFVLSEIYEHAHSTVSLGRFEAMSGPPTTSKTATATTTNATTTTTATPSVTFPPFGILYLFWNQEQTAEQWIEECVWKVVQRIEEHCLIESSTDHGKDSNHHHQHPAKRTAGLSPRIPEAIPKNASHHQDSKLESTPTNITPAPTITTTTTTTTTPSVASCSNPLDARQKISLYLVVERLCPDGTTFAEQEILVQDFARQVSTHPQLRSRFEGLTIGLSNHERAGPALEACMNTFLIGSRERRLTAAAAVAGLSTTIRSSSSPPLPLSLSSSPPPQQQQQQQQQHDPKKSLVGLIVSDEEQLLGEQSADIVDAVDGIQQIRISAEWCRRGNLQSFAERAQTVWRIQQGEAFVKDNVGHGRGGIIHHTADVLLGGWEHGWKDWIGYMLIIVYIAFHFNWGEEWKAWQDFWITKLKP